MQSGRLAQNKLDKGRTSNIHFLKLKPKATKPYYKLNTVNELKSQ